MYIGLAVLVITLFIAFGERLNKMDFNLKPADWFLLIILLVLAICSQRKWFKKQWEEFKRERKRRKLLYSNWYDELFKDSNE